MTLLVPVVYMIEGALIVPSNLILIAAILSVKKLRERKELVMLLGLALSDSVSGFGTFLLGYYRVSLPLSTGANFNEVKVSPWHCFSFRTGLVPLFAGGLCSSMFMLAMTSERICAVLFFARFRVVEYRTLAQIACSLILLTLIFMALGAYDVHLTSKSGRQVSIVCGIGYTRYFSTFHSGFGGTLALLSVLGYGIVLWGHKNLKTTTNGKKSTQTETKAIERQKHLTKTIGIITLFTLFFNSIPFLSAMVLIKFNLFGLATVFWMLVPVNSIASFYIMYWQQKEVRESMKALGSWARCFPKATSTVTVLTPNLK